MAGRAVGFDPGSHTLKVLQIQDGKQGVAVLRFAAVPAEEPDGLGGTGVPLKDAVAGLAGRDMILRYNQVPPSTDWQLRNLMELEIQDLAQQSGGDLSADFNVLPTQDPEAGMDTVLMALARNDALQKVSEAVAGAGGSVGAHVPNCVALYNAWLRLGQVEPDAVVCLVNLGHTTIDIALAKGADLLFARNLSNGGKVLDDAISSAFNVSERKAEQLKKDLLDLDPESRGRFASGQAEKVTMAAGGAASVFVSAIQSSLAFCQAQTKIGNLRLDKVLLCGGSARIRGVTGLLREALRCPVEVFDPFQATDLSQLPPAEAQQLDAMRSEAVVALGLALTRTDDNLYSLEILPERVKRQKRFRERTVFEILAGAVAAGVLAFVAMDRKAEYESLTVAANRMRIQRNQAQSTHDAATGLANENQARRALVEALAEKAAPMDGTLRALEALAETLPPELWLTSLELKRIQAAGGPRGAGPGLQLEFAGFGKELGGKEVGGVYREFSRRFKERLPNAEAKSDTVMGMADRTSFRVQVDLRATRPKDQDAPQGKGE